MSSARSPEIDFPGAVEPDAEVLVGAIVCLSVRRVLAVSVVGIVADRILNLRVLGADGDSQLRARLEDAQAGGLQSQVLPVSDLNQIGKDWLFEDLPPGAEVLWLSRERL
jgi:hypothetical protein